MAESNDESRRSLEVLRLFEAGPAPTRVLFGQIPRSTAYWILRRLVREHLLAREGKGLYRLLPAGRDALDAAGGASGPRSLATGTGGVTLEGAIPHLRYAPTALHRGLLELIACAVVARKHRLLPSHHPAFVVFGPKLKFKTWTARAACLMAGADPQRSVINLVNESGRSLTTRKGAAGQTLSLREGLTQPVVGLDEYLRAKPDVRRLAQVYLFGEIEVPNENELLTIEPVPVVTLNPREGKEELDERLGLDEAMIRRSIVADLAEVEIPDAVLCEGDALLEKIRDLGAVEFPLPQAPTWQPRQEVKACLLATLDSPDRLGMIDITMLAMLATAATAWLERGAALALVLGDYLGIVEHLGWTRPDWRDRLQLSATPGAAAPAPAPREPNPLDYEDTLRALYDACREFSMAPEEVAEMATLIGAEVERVGIEPAEGARRFLDCLAAHDKLEDLEARVSADARALEARQQKTAEALRVASIEASEATHFVSAAREFASASGVEQQDAAVAARHAVEMLAAELRRRGGKTPDVRAAIVQIVEAPAWRKAAEEDARARRDALEKEVRKLDGYERTSRATYEKTLADFFKKVDQCVALDSMIANTKADLEAKQRELASVGAELEKRRRRLALVEDEHRALATPSTRTKPPDAPIPGPPPEP